MDNDLRNRFRRDFSKETARPARPRPAADITPHRPRPQHKKPKEPAANHSAPAHQPHAAPEPAIQHPAPEHHAYAAPVTKPPKRRKKRRRLFIVFIILMLLAGAGAGGYWYWSNKLKSPIPVSVRAAVNFPVLYPTQLPAGYHLDQSSYNASGNVVLYSAVNSSGTKIAFTVQQRPATFDFNKFYTQSLSGSSTFTAPLGKAAVGTASGKLLGSLATGKSWLLVSSSSSSVKSGDLKLILNHLKLSSR